jgi:uncharacterized protein (DUF2249 family)
MNTPEVVIDPDQVMDVRAIPCSVKHGAIVRAFQQLAVGDFFILLNDRDPARLREQFSAQWPGRFIWQYLELDPDNFRVKISKTQPLPAENFPDSACAHH